MKEATPTPAPTPFKAETRQLLNILIHSLYTDREMEHLDLECRGFLMFLEQMGILTATSRELVVDRVMALDAAECRAMIDACRANGVRLGVAYYRRFYPVLRRIRELLAAGEIGRVALASIQAFEWHCVPEGSERSWFLRKDRAGGGPLMDFGCHRIEVLLNLLGPVDEALGLAGNTLFQREVEDTATVAVRWRSGALGSVNVTMLAFPRNLEGSITIIG